MILLKYASDDAGFTSQMILSQDDDDTNKSESEIPSDLIISDILPEIDENSLSSLSEDDDDNNFDDTKKLIKQKEIDDIKFKTKHFDKDTSTSSSDDDSITRGLSFNELSTIKEKKIIATNSKQNDNNNQLTSQIQSLVNWGVNNVMKNVIQQEISNNLTKKFVAESSDEDDYEFISQDDLNS